jgi:dipeptidyl aminopeptidase/acylaminoacyl peptidase
MLNAKARIALSAAIVFIAPTLLAQSTPTMKQWLSLRTVGAPVLAPDGSGVAYGVTSTDWENNRFDTEIWLARAGGEPIQLTSTEKESSTTPRWSPDSRWIAFLTDRGDGRQIYIIRAAGGEAHKVTNIKGGIGDYAWSPDGSSIAFSSVGPEGDDIVARKKTYGEFSIENGDFRLNRLWVVPVDTSATTATARALPVGNDRNVGNFAWSPDGRRIAFSHTPNPLLSNGGLSDISIIDVSSGAVQPLVTGPGADSDPLWSPDGTRILFSTADGDTTANFYRNSHLAIVPAAGGAVNVLARTFDENPGSAVWLPSGIRFIAAQGVTQKVFTLDPATGATRVLLSSPDVIRAASYSRDGSVAAIAAENATTLPEVYRVALPSGQPLRLTNMSAQVAGWSLGSREMVSWVSKDGARIEGVLYKPNGYVATKRYPLLVAIHGGPTGISRPVLGYGSVYPIEQFLAKGAVVLMPNYRGSAGYGEKFRSLNVRNLGVGDAWDVLSGVDSLVARGIADSTRLGSMGWSQGGYISAFLTTTSQRFKAISVGAGISDWMTYYVSTDIHPFTRQYLKATPWSDPSIYAETSPITYIKQAKTPTLIQHGELDRRVPIANAYELYQGLQDVGVPSRLVVYKGFGHGITKPKEQLAATWHNWQWFSKYIWGEDVTLPTDGERVTASVP